MPQPYSREDEEADRLRERILGTESAIHLKTWYPRLKEAMAELKALNAQLEERIRQRTEELSRANDELARKNRDLEESRERLLAAERLAEHGRLAGKVAHELNTPLGALLSSCSSLVEESRRSALASQDCLGEMSGGGRAMLAAFVDSGLRQAPILAQRPSGRSVRKRFTQILASFGVEAAEDWAEALEELGLGPDSPQAELQGALGHPELVSMARALTAPARSAAIARLAALKAAEAIRELGDSGRQADSEYLNGSSDGGKKPKA
jgi:hypothetical protein